MNVSLPPKLQDFVRRKVQSGEFSSSDDVFCEGLRLLQRREVLANDATRKIEVGWKQAQNGRLRSGSEVAQNLATRKKAFKSASG
jgi:putative addiction module CopG family antidote